VKRGADTKGAFSVCRELPNLPRLIHPRLSAHPSLKDVCPPSERQRHVRLQSILFCLPLVKLRPHQAVAPVSPPGCGQSREEDQKEEGPQAKLPESASHSAKVTPAQ
jgi:hypothetical protein